VEQILESLHLNHIPTLRVLNKLDLVEKEFAEIRCHKFNAIAISATDTKTLKPLIEAMEERIRRIASFNIGA
jgi:GTP-binding protein HflX